MKGLARIGFVLALLCAGLAFPITAAQACTCAEATPAQNFKTADVVFLGTVLGRDPPAGSDEAASASEVTFTFAVRRVFKGEVAATQPVVSQGLAGFCGQTFPDDDSVLVFADDETERGAPQRYVTELCSGSEIAGAAPARFGAGKVPVGYVKPRPAAASGGSSTVVLLVAAGAVVAAAAGGGALFSRHRRSRPPSSGPAG
jgi:hypothetical protein